jgi:hypothetical protein
MVARSKKPSPRKASLSRGSRGSGRSTFERARMVLLESMCCELRVCREALQRIGATLDRIDGTLDRIGATFARIDTRRDSIGTPLDRTVGRA